MALNTAQAEAAVVALLTDMSTRIDNTAAGAQQARRDYARDLVAAVATLIRSGTVSGTASVTTTGGATAQTGGGTITGTIS
jgi:hypothetical protein